MNIASWLRKRRVRSASARHGQPRFRAHNRPCIESLEQRCLLSTLTVLNNADTGAGSLRATLAAAHNGDTITFASSLRGKTITLTSGQLTVTKSIDIKGLGRDELTISGGNASRVFAVASGSYRGNRSTENCQRLGQPGGRDRQLRHADSQPVHAVRQHGCGRQRR